MFVLLLWATSRRRAGPAYPCATASNFRSLNLDHPLCHDCEAYSGRQRGVHFARVAQWSRAGNLKIRPKVNHCNEDNGVPYGNCDKGLGIYLLQVLKLQMHCWSILG